MGIEDEIIKRAEATPVHKFKMDGLEVWVREMTIDDEKMVARRCQGDATNAIWEQVTQCVTYVNGVAVNAGDGSAEKAMAKLSPKQRVKVMAAVQRVHGVSAEETEAFLKTASVEV